MIKFEFNLNSESERQITGLDLGTLSIVGDTGSYTSMGKRPDQSMMILPTMVGAMDAVKKLKRDFQRNNTEHTFTGVDSSVEVGFRKQGNSVKVFVGPQFIGAVSLEDLAAALGDACHIFYGKVRDRIPSDDIGMGDLEEALKEFDSEFPRRQRGMA